MPKIVSWDLKCPNCGFEFGIATSLDEPAEIIKELRCCPCGTDTETQRERIYEDGEDNGN